MRAPNAYANLPFIPNGLTLLYSYMWHPIKKYLVSSGILDIHWRPEFMKHVLPRF